MRVLSPSRFPFVARMTGILPVALVGLLGALGCGGGGSATNPPIDNPKTPDETLREALAVQGVHTPALPPTQDAAQVELGRMLFFDKILSSRGDISCSGCHHPTLAMADGIPISKGTNGEGLGPERRIFDGQTMVARNATDVFNRGLPAWRTMLWDARVEQLANGRVITPAGAETPEGLSGVLAGQAILAMADDREMHSEVVFFPFAGSGAGEGDPGSGGGMGNGKGEPGFGDGGIFLPPIPPLENPDETFTDIWRNITNRVVFQPGYQPLITAAYPETPLQDITIAHLANAIAAFQTEKLTALDSPFDRYLRGDDAALTSQQKQGAILFYGKANCSSCHTGELLTDQSPHNLLVPELGPGKESSPGADRGRIDVTDSPNDAYGFRTPPLRNVGETGPYMHNGAIGTLEDVVRHHLDPVSGFLNLDIAHLPDELEGTVKNSPADLNAQRGTLDPKVATPITLTNEEVDALVAFLGSLSDPSIPDRIKDIEPAEVPSNISTSYGEGGEDPNFPPVTEPLPDGPFDPVIGI